MFAGSRSTWMGLHVLLRQEVGVREVGAEHQQDVGVVDRGARIACPKLRTAPVPPIGVIISAAEVTVMPSVVFTAPYGSDRHSSRAFRLLWLLPKLTRHAWTAICRSDRYGWLAGWME
jgi:hypothetical protein